MKTCPASGKQLDSTKTIRNTLNKIATHSFSHKGKKVNIK